MDKTEQLFIRACKARDPIKRVNSVYRRFYLASKDKNTSDDSIAIILTSLCEKYVPMKMSNLIEDLHPNSDWKFARWGSSYSSRVIAVIVSHIRLSEVKMFPGLVSPIVFRKLKDIPPE